MSKLFTEREFETPPSIARATGSSPDTIRTAINRGELEAHNFGTKKRPSWRVSKSSWEAYLALKSNIAVAKAKRKKRAKRPMVRVREYV